MMNRLSDLITRQAKTAPSHPAVIFKQQEMTYGQLADEVRSFGHGLLAAGMNKNDRVAIYLPKQMETVISFFGPAYAGGVFVPINPVLKPHQVAYILKNCGARFLVTSADRWVTLKDELTNCPGMERVIITGDVPDSDLYLDYKITSYCDFLAQDHLMDAKPHDVTNADMAAILYTSGSTGLPKGVVLSHGNMIVGAQSVASYLKNTSEDRILSVLPLSFDAGLSQLTTAFSVGASAILMTYLLPRDVIRQAEKYKVTGITFVPPLLLQMGDMAWPKAVKDSLRYIATTGGKMPVSATSKFRKILPKSDIYLMYGLTEAFRSTYLPPSEIDRIPGSIGKAIPQADVRVVREDGSLCDVGEEGELIHLGPLVGMGYWNDPERTAQRFRPVSSTDPARAVWSGDRVIRDKDGYLYFVGRGDDMIKTSGFRTSPNEVEDIIQSSGLVTENAAVGREHEQLGQVIWVVAVAPGSRGLDMAGIMAYCRTKMPSYMVPHRVIEWKELPKNANGKIDRKVISRELDKEKDA